MIELEQIFHEQFDFVIKNEPSMRPKIQENSELISRLKDDAFKEYLKTLSNMRERIKTMRNQSSCSWYAEICDLVDVWRGGYKRIALFELCAQNAIFRTIFQIECGVLKET